VHVGTKKSPSDETGLHLVFREEHAERRYYAALQDLVIIEISDNGYYQAEYDTSPPASLWVGTIATAQAARKARGGSYTISRAHAREESPAARMRSRFYWNKYNTARTPRTGAVLSFAFPFLP
jgi:hypothetical protein